MRGSRRSRTEVANAVGISLVKGVPAASKATGIPQRTLRRYKDDPELAELGLSAREDVARSMWVGIQVGLDEVFRGMTDPDEPLKAKSDALFGLMEQHALMTGGVTSRSETKDTSLDLDPRVQRELRSRFADLVRDSGDGMASQDELEGAATPSG